ncbi:hypothetical protein P3W85_09160 [Cupriavidus basilensis]|uniref:AsnC family transcriptional regulator n=1 Tax=Cupriavidus basilensis TaxID=68895 RepID=A0ABT6AKI5_9BURK|nr:hypothetical protein [Cupriavidus basilensis]MDF3833117.1 hypothetical protein [Cupriavidus basilensis]
MNSEPHTPSASDTMPTLNLALRLERNDLFGAIEWTLANARRTGLTLIDLCFGQAAAPHQLTLSVGADNADLLPLFLRRMENGADVLEIFEIAAPADAQAVPAVAAGPSPFDAPRTVPVGHAHAAPAQVQ